MARGLDHIVHAVRDLDAARAFYERLGFQVGARNRHPWGTENRLVQFPGFFLEILAVIEPEKTASATFGAFNNSFLNEVGEGLSGLVVEGHDPKGERAALDVAGFGGIPLLEFSRQGKRADGSDVEVGFKIAFARYPAAPHALFFTCMQTAPKSFWSAGLQRHPNGTLQIAAAVLVAENPTDHHIFLKALVGVHDIRATSMGLTIKTPRGAIQVMDPRSFKQAFGIDAPKDDGLRLAALVFTVADLKATLGLLEKNGVPTREQAGRLVVEPEKAFGAVLAFGA